MTSKRLIGFKVIISEHPEADSFFRTIRSICPLVDTFDAAEECENTVFDLTGIEPMIAQIGYGPVTQTFKSDYFSTYYQQQDGYSFCKDSYILTTKFFTFCDTDSGCSNGAHITETDVYWLKVDEDTNLITIDSDPDYCQPWCQELEDPLSVEPIEAFVNITIEYPTEQEREYAIFSIQLVCSDLATSATCTGVQPPDDVKDPPTLDYTIPVCSQNIEGHVQTNPENDMWYVEHRFYRLTSVKLWSDNLYTSGFEVTYEAPESFTGWEPITRMFGNDAATEEPYTINLENDLWGVELCA